MENHAYLERAFQIGEEFRLLVDGVSIPANTRSRLSSSYYWIAMDHHHAILLLIQENLNSSAFALLRVQFEAYVRGVWVWIGCDDTALGKFSNGGEPPMFSEMLKQIEGHPNFSNGDLSRFKQKNWGALCDYTHTGLIHLSRWNGDTEIVPNFDDKEIQEVIWFTGLLGSLSVTGIAQIIDSQELAYRAFQAINKWGSDPV